MFFSLFPIGDTFDILALINNSVNFILYCLMSRAFRDTFKQTFCFICQKFDRRESAVSFTQLPITKTRQNQLNPSAVYEPISTYQCPDDPKLIGNHSTTISLLNDNQSNGLFKKTSGSS